jgi:hypothetical protein
MRMARCHDHPPDVKGIDRAHLEIVPVPYLARSAYVA